MTRPDTREEILSLAVDAMEDAAAGMRYVRQHYGDLSGVGFDRVQEKYLTVVGKLRAAPTPPAAEAPGQEPVAELDIDATAENIARHVATSAKSGRIHQLSYGPAKLAALIALRMVSAPPTYADAEAKWFERGIEVAAKWHDEQALKAFGSTLDFGGAKKLELRGLADRHAADATAIRSLASPAPKGET